MGHIGTIIKKYRQASGMSRKALSDSICSEKHIYLIEKGERAPSATLLKLLSGKLGVNLFDFYPYMGCTDPFVVREKLKGFYIYRINLDFDSLKKVSEEAKSIPDFKNNPWNFEIRLNSIYYMAFEDKLFEEAAVQLKNLLEEAEPWGLSDMFRINAYTLMTTCCLIMKDAYNAKKAALAAYGIFRDKHEIEMYEKLATKTIVNLMGAYYINGEYDDVISKGNEFIHIKQKLDSYGKIHFVYFFMALAYYSKEMRKEAAEFLKKAVYFLMSDYSPQMSIMLRWMKDFCICWMIWVRIRK